LGDLVELQNVSKRFGSLIVIENLSLTLAEGEALGVVGPNGAGKTTMLNLVAGDLRPTSGEVVFAGRNVTNLAAHVRCKAGMGRTAQIPRPFEGLTVFENVLAGATFGERGRRRQDMDAAAVTAMSVAGILDKANALARSLTLLDRKRLELARALATEPRLLLLDEIAGGLTELEIQRLITTIKQIRERGVSVIWIEHIVHALLSVVDRLLAMDYGRVLLDGDPHEVMASKEVQDVYLGVEMDADAEWAR
jgi:branched-chain amino acid transport system ATP-binding protein